MALAATLRAAGFRVLRRVTYGARPARALPPAALRLLREAGAAALFFSPETARIFARLLPESAMVNTAEALAISAATAAALAPLPWARIRVASHPNQDALLALLP
jgi:uroporphyrinogen-III synthase